MGLPELRAAFADGPSAALAAAVGGPVAPWTPPHTVSAITRCFADEDRLVVVVGGFEPPGHVDRGLAYGLALAGDRDLVLVLPEGTAAPTLRRAPWIDVPLEIWTHDGSTAVRRHIPARAEVLASYTDQLVTAEHQLGDAAALVERVVDWAVANPVLASAHRKSYLAWHCAGRQVLRLARTKQGGVEIRAGVQYTAPTADQPVPVHVTTDAPLTAVQEHRVVAAAAQAIADRLEGVDVGHAEHRMQAALHANPRRLGLLERPFLREFPAMRAAGSRGFIDFLGVDGTGRVHVVETKIGHDEMLVLQGLDYWIWATAHLTELEDVLGVGGHPPALDFVVAGRNGQPPVGRYTAGQAEALDGSIPWRFHVIGGWDDAGVRLTSLASRTPPPAPRHDRPRFAARLQGHLREHHGTGFFADPSSAVVGPARWVIEDLGVRGRLHRFFSHVRSSQRFAVNLFGPLDEVAVAALLAELDMPVVEAERPVFEFEDETDRLAEATPGRPHRTQVDVLLRGRAADGRKLVALVEVKLSELDFGHCSAYESTRNDRRDVCHRDGAFGDDPAACFQLRNHGGPHRRRYDVNLAPVAFAPPDAGCAFRRGVNQPMRNVALARVLLETGDAAAVTHALCAPMANGSIWRRWAEASAVLATQPIALRALPVDSVLAHHPADQAALLRQTYAFPGEDS